MSDRHNAFVVVLDRDYKDEDAEQILNAIRMVKGVLTVTPNVVSMLDHVAYSKARADLGNKIMKVLTDKES